MLALRRLTFPGVVVVCPLIAENATGDSWCQRQKYARTCCVHTTHVHEVCTIQSLKIWFFSSIDDSAWETLMSSAAVCALVTSRGMPRLPRYTPRSRGCGTACGSTSRWCAATSRPKWNGRSPKPVGSIITISPRNRIYQSPSFLLGCIAVLPFSMPCERRHHYS